MEVTKKTNGKVIVVAIVVLVLLVVVAAIWINGQKQGKAEAMAEIEELKLLVAEQEGKIKELEEAPILVNPVNPEIVLDIVQSEIKEIGELASMEYFYTNAAVYSDSHQIFGKDISITEKGFTIKWDGVIKAGIDVNRVRTEIVNDSLVVYMPKADILSHETDEDSIEVLEEHNGLFNDVKVEDQIELDAKSKKEMENRAKENGLIEKAQANAEQIILRLVTANPDVNENYTVQFKIVEE